MSNGRDCSFWDLYKQTPIKIPQIQRDYVQGRRNARVEANRASFAKSLVDSLVNNKRITLNFIYGYSEGGCFIPIDGQQRLTTLFLLHYLVFSKADRKKDLLIDGHRNFSYQTRYTTDRFLNALFDSDIDLSGNSSLKERITNSAWYTYSWNNDPSIVSFVVMLSELNEAFGDHDDWEEYACRLVSAECPIRFMLLETREEQFGKPDQLYIRMNSRGKQLTDFENFKASLYAYADDCDNAVLKSLISQVKDKIDGDWETLIWSFAESEEIAEKYSDLFYRDLIHWIFTNRLGADDKLHFNEDWLRPSYDAISGIYLENYIDASGDSLESCIRDIWLIMSAIMTVKEQDIELYKRIVQTVLRYGVDKKGNYDSYLSEYKTRVILHSLARYGRETEGRPFDLRSFDDWYRIIINLTANTEIDDPKAFCRALQSIDRFDGVLSLEIDPSLLVQLNGFASRQIEEEVFKLKVAGISDSWKKAILKAESNQYFQGEILFSMLMAGVTAPEKAIDIDPDDYLRFWSVVEKVFNFIHGNDNLFHRALLTYGDYSVKAPGGVGDAGVRTFFQYSEKHHNYDWRGLLRPVNGTLSEPALIFKSFLEDCTVNDPTDVANERIKAYSLPADPTVYDRVIYYLIKHHELFEYCHKYYYLWHDTFNSDWDRYLLMKTSKRNTYVEVMAFTFNVLANNKKVSIKEGGNPSDPEARRSYATYKNKAFWSPIFEFKRKCFTDGEDRFIADSTSFSAIVSPEVLIHELNLDVNK